jgi:hypothetical protein
MAYMLDNKYLNTAVQKAFVDGIPGCTEHHLKLLSILNEARQKHKSLCICWLDLANTFGSVHHNLIGFAFRRYHAPPTFINIITNLYQNLYGIVSTPNQLACPIQLQRGVYQGDPLCWCLTLAVMNTLLDTIAHCHPDHGYRLGCFPQRTNTLQYADDTTLIADGPSSCQSLLDTTETWLSWSGQNANVSKCVSLAIKSSSAKVFDPKLHLSSETIPFIGNGTYSFLGATVYIHQGAKQA